MLGLVLVSSDSQFGDSQNEDLAASLSLLPLTFEPLHLHVAIKSRPLSVSMLPPSPEVLQRLPRSPDSPKDQRTRAIRS